MTKDKFLEICHYLKHILDGSDFVSHTYVVGGAVRDFVMGNEIKDIDLVVSLPSGGINLANWLYDNDFLIYKPVLYPTYGTSMFQLKEFPDIELEAVQTRKEQYKDKNSRNPETAYGTIQEDAMRRDLTINALYYSIDTAKIVDVTGKGLNDIENHIIRVTSDPDIVYQDDALRILRCIRFASRFGWNVEDATYRGMIRNVNRLEIITKERVKDELNKMLLVKKPSIALSMIRAIGAMDYVIPALGCTYYIKQNKYHDYNTVWDHTMMVLDNSLPKLELRMAALLHDIGKIRTKTVDEDGTVHFYRHELESSEMCDTILRELKYSNDFIRKVQIMIRNHMRTKQFGDDLSTMKTKTLLKLEYELGKDNFNDCLDLIDADNLSHGKEYCMPNQVKHIREKVIELEKQGISMFDYHLPINGNDVMETLGIPPSSEVKDCLKWAMKFAYNNPNITREKLLKQIKQWKT